MIKQTTVFDKCGVFSQDDSGDLLFQNPLESLEELRQLANVDLVVIAIARKAIRGDEGADRMLDQGTEMLLVRNLLASHG